MTPAPVLVVGSVLSPYVRKVLVCLGHKAIPYEIDPIVPFFGDERFSKLSPLRRIPVFRDDRVTLCDSSVICQYLEERHPEPALYPLDVASRARARWLEEFADTRMGEVFVWHLFNQVAIRPFVWGEAPDREVVAKATEQEIPEILDYLEAELPSEGFACGGFGIADIALASFFRNARFARYTLDGTRWPTTAAWLDRALASDGFQRLAPFEEVALRTPIAGHRDALAAAGAPISAETFATPSPQRGVMSLG